MITRLGQGVATAFFLLAIGVLSLSCSDYGGPSPEPGAPPIPTSFEPLNPNAVVFWGRFTEEIEDLIVAMAEDFNARHEGLPIAIEYAGGYGEIYRKTITAIHAGRLPSMSVAYESMTAEYAGAGAAVPVGDYIRDPEVGLDLESFEDFFPAVLDTNKLEQFDGRMFSFPFAKSVLMLYFNKGVLREAGLSGEPPATWDEFLAQARAVKEETGKYAYAIDVDCSTVDGIILSMGGDIVDGMETQFHAGAAIEAFELFETLHKERLGYRIQRGTYDDHVAFSRDEVAFVIRTSASRTGMGQLMGFDEERWGMAPLPQADPAHPRSLLFGPNVVIFRTAPEHERRAWEFVRDFTSKEGTVRWALGTGYLPLRRSAAEHPDMQAFWDEWPYNRVAFDCLEYAEFEPNLSGWQQVRPLVEEAQTAVLTGMKTGRAAAEELKRKADAVLAEQARSRRIPR